MLQLDADGICGQEVVNTTVRSRIRNSPGAEPRSARRLADSSPQARPSSRRDRHRNAGAAAGVRGMAAWNEYRAVEQDSLAMPGGLLRRSSFTETIAQVPARARTTQRLRTQIGAAVGDAARSVTEVAAAHGVSWPTAHRAFVAHAEAVLTEPEPTRVLGIDETRRGKPRWILAETGRWVRVDPWDTGFVDLAGVQGLLGQREGRTGAAVIAWLSERTRSLGGGRARGHRPRRRLRIRDPHAGAVAERHAGGRSLPPREACQRRAHQGAPPRHLGPAGSSRPADRPGIGEPETAAAGAGTLVGQDSAKMWNRIQAEDPSAQILSAWIAKEELRTLLSTVRLGGDPHLTRHRLHRFLSWCIDSQIPELLTLATTIDQWWPKSTRSCGPPSPTPAPRATTGCSNRSSASVADSYPRALGPPDTIPLHPQTAGRNPDFMLIARSKLKSQI